jgi:anti-sigma B factor antagonist
MLLQIVERQVEPDITIVALSGELALGKESQQIENIIDDLVKRGSRRLVLDLSGVSHIDSTGVGMVALASGKLKEAGGRLTVVAPEGKVLHILKLTQMNTIMQVCPTVADAVGAA